jgi:hypothetical protein
MIGTVAFLAFISHLGFGATRQLSASTVIGRQAPLRKVSIIITAVEDMIPTKESAVSRKELNDAVEDVFRRAEVPTSAAGYPAFENAGVLQLWVTASKLTIERDVVYGLTVDAKVVRYIQDPLYPKGVVEAIYWEEKESFTVFADKLGETIKRSTEKLTQLLCRDWTAAHSDSFKYPDELDKEANPIGDKKSTTSKDP